MPEQIENRMVCEHEHYKVVCRCHIKGCDIYEDEYFYDFDGDVVCADCMEDYVKEHYRRIFNGY